MLLYAYTSETFIMIIFLGKTMDFNCVIYRKFISIFRNELNKRIEIRYTICTIYAYMYIKDLK